MLVISSKNSNQKCNDVGMNKKTPITEHKTKPNTKGDNDETIPKSESANKPKSDAIVKITLNTQT